MGTWGTGLFSDDTAHDIKDDYIHALRKGKTPEEAVGLLKETFRPEGSDDEGLFWVCLAVLQWDYGHLSPEIREKALEHLPCLWDPDIWTREKDRAKRRQLAEQVRAKLTAPQLSPKKIYKYRGKRCKWKLGEVYSMQFDDFQRVSSNLPHVKVYRDMAQYSCQFGAFCVIDILRVKDPDREVVDEFPLVVIYDWIAEHRPSMEELAHVPTIRFRDHYDSPDDFDKYPVHNCVCVDTPCKTDITRINVDYVGQTQRFAEEGFAPEYVEYANVLMTLQSILLESRLYLKDSLSHKAGW